MLPVTIRSAPELEGFIPIEEYQSTTPETFFGGKPVLHHHAQGAKVWIARDQVAELPIFSGEPAPSAAVAPAGTSGIETGDLVERTVDIFVGSDHFTLFSAEANTGVSIPYPAISIHAVKPLGAAPADGGPRPQAVWMQLELSDSGAADDDEPASIDLTVVPAAGTAQQLYDAISACSDLHPDRGDDESDDDDRIVFEGDHEALDGFTGVMRGRDDGGLPPPFPGSSGWITAENMHEYFDADGNWIGDGAEEEEGEEGGTVSGELGEGAGRTRTRDEVNGHGGDGGEAADDPENKRPRVDEPSRP